MKKESDIGPVVIVVSDDSECNKVAVEDIKIESIVNVEEEDKEISDANKPCKDKVTNTHNLLCKYNSYPLQDRIYSNNHLRVPSNVSSCDTDTSIYSSDESLTRTDGLSSCSNCNLDSISRCLSPEVDSSLNVDKCNDENDRSLSLSHKKILQSSENNLNPERFTHKPLTRAASAPLKSNEQSDEPVQNRLLDNKENTSRLSLFVSPKVWKSAVKRVRSAEPSPVAATNRFSLRRTVSNSLRGWSKESGNFISFPSKDKKKPRQRYRIVEAKTGQRDGLSFEVVGKQGTFLRVKGSLLIPDKDTSDTYFNKDCTFVPLPDMWFPSFFAFESVSKPSYFIRLTSHEELVLEKYDCTVDFKEEASFQLNRKPCATCLQVGIQTWARKGSGEFSLGKVISIKGEMVEVKFNDGRTVIYPMSDTGDLVPDIIPSADDISIGTRVIAQWLSRHKLYPGVVSGIRGGDSYEVLFDDGDVCREKAFQIRLVRAYFFHADENESNASSGKGGYDYNHCGEDDICVHQNYKNNFTENSHSRLSSADSHLESPGMSDVLSTGQSSTIINSELNENCYINPQNKHYAFPPWEIETFSQDSGYHGYGKQNNGKLNTDDTDTSPSKIYDEFNDKDNPCKYDYAGETINQTCRKVVRSKSLENMNVKTSKLEVRKTKSLSFKNISSYDRYCTYLVNR